jgi:cyanophycinase-like exopeptidase
MTMGNARAMYLLAGGRRSARRTPDPLLCAMLAETGKSEPSVAYLGAASGDDRFFFRLIKGRLKEAGAGEVDLVKLVSPSASVAAARRLLLKADVVFVSGGDVEEGMRILVARKVTALLRERFEAGAVFGGFSAGSIMLAHQWVRWRNGDDDDSAETFDCLGFAPLLCDTHAEEDDWAELKALLRARRIDGEIGYGIQTDTGLRIHPDGKTEALGGAVIRLAWRRNGIHPGSPLVPPQ